MSWDRRRLKKQGKQTLKKHYMKMIIICLILMMIGGEFSTTREIVTESTLPKNPNQIESRLPTSISKSTTVVDFFIGLYGNGTGTNNALQKKIGKLMDEYRPTRGVLAEFFSSITANNDISIGILNAFNNIVFKNRIGNGILILLANILSLAFLFFIGKMLTIGGRRYFLESRRYANTRMERLLFVYSLDKTWKAVKVMIRLTIYQTLWTLTIIGGFIKRYSYYMVPFIMAENPEITGKTAIKLSRQMMNGNKWKLFVLDLTYMGWNILNMLSFGLVGIFYLNAYRTAVDSEIYAVLRQYAKEGNMHGADLLCDDALFTHAASESEYDMNEYIHPLPVKKRTLRIDYDRKYSLLHLVLMFFVIAFIGWLWEVSLHLIEDGEFVNRGVFLGPYLPIYGFGGVAVLVLLRPVRESIIKTFALAVVVSGVIEYATSWFLEWRYHEKWWDYTGYLLNLNGRICLEGLLVFGLGACLVIYIVAPVVDSLLSRIPNRLAKPIALALILCFLIDFAHAQTKPNSGKGITDYDHATADMEYLPKCSPKVESSLANIWDKTYNSI